MLERQDILPVGICLFLLSCVYLKGFDMNIIKILLFMCILALLPPLVSGSDSKEAAESNTGALKYTSPSQNKIKSRKYFQRKRVLTDADNCVAVSCGQTILKSGARKQINIQDVNCILIGNADFNVSFAQIGTFKDDEVRFVYTLIPLPGQTGASSYQFISKATRFYVGPGERLVFQFVYSGDVTNTACNFTGETITFEQ